MMKVEPNPASVLYSLAFLIGCSAIFMFAYLTPQIFNYFLYSNEIPVGVEKVEIVELGENFYAPKATFTYGQVRRDEILETMAENNPYLVEDRVKEWVSGNIVGYSYNNQCTLQKSFPIKQTIYTVVLIGLALYFVFLAKAKV